MKNSLPLFLLSVSACAIGPDAPRSNLTLPEAYTTAYSAPKTDEGLWWDGFEDAQLDKLIRTAINDNLNVVAADARLRAAEAIARAQVSDFFPNIDGGISVQFPEGSAPQAATSLSAGWSPDIFGAQRQALYLARANAVSASASARNARRLTASAVAATYVELRRTDAQVALLRQSLDLQQQTLRIVTLRAEAGLAADLDVQRAAGDLARTQAQSGPFTEARTRASNALAALSGKTPGTVQIEANARGTIPSYKQGLSEGVPADLLRNRPDVQAAEANLVAAGQAIGIQMADLLPSLNLSGFITSPLGTDDLAFGAFSRANAALNVPLLDAGRRWAEVRAARAQADEALALYEQAILTAFQDVENSLVAIQAAEERLSDLDDAVSASEIAFDQLQALYTEGLATLIDVLDAQRQLIASREAYTNSEASVAQAYVNLYTALGAPVEIASGDDQSSDLAG
ncbi:MAG: efflux transporter outer membrane subunit [Pseudomonadota bacterium]